MTLGICGCKLVIPEILSMYRLFIYVIMISEEGLLETSRVNKRNDGLRKYMVKTADRIVIITSIRGKPLKTVILHLFNRFLRPNPESDLNYVIKTCA